MDSAHDLRHDPREQFNLLEENRYFNYGPAFLEQKAAEMKRALDAAWDLVRDFTLVERHVLRDGVPRHALKLPFRGGTVRDLAREAVKIAIGGLQRRARLNSKGVDEAGFLDALVEIVEANETPAERKLALFHGEWNGSVDPVFREFAY